MTEAGALARVEEIRLQNFRAFDNARLRLSDLTMLVGRNGAGKSSVLDAVEFLREAVTDNLPNALARRDGFGGVLRKGAAEGEALGVAVVMKTTIATREVRMLYGFQVSDGGDAVTEVLQVSPQSSLGFRRVNAMFESGRGIQPALPRDRLVLPLIADDQLWGAVWDTVAGMRAYEIAPRAVGDLALIRNAHQLDRYGANAGDVLAEVQGRPAALAAVVDALREVTPGIQTVRVGTMHGRRDITFGQAARGATVTLSTQQVSQGTLRALGILLALHQSPTPSLVLLDEVEDSIHPHALDAVMEAVEAVLGRFPVLVTTHSPEVLGTRHATPDRVRILQWKDGVSHMYPLAAGTRANVDALTTVGDLLRVNALWPDEVPEGFTGDLLELSP